MLDMEYPSNSRKSKELEKTEEKRVVKAVTSNAKIKKKSEIRKLTDVFVTEDITSVGQYIFTDVFAPAVKKAIVDIVCDGINMLMYGEGGRSSRNNSPASKISYRSYYDSGSGSRRNVNPVRRTHSAYDYDDIIIDSRGEAEEVLMRMDEMIEQYDVVRVADFYELVGVTGEHTDNKYGWTDIRNARIVRTRDGYMIKLPKAMPLD